MISKQVYWKLFFLQFGPVCHHLIVRSYIIASPVKMNINILTSETVPKLFFFFTLMVLLGGPAEESKHDQRSGGSGRCCLENSSWLELHQIEYVLAGWPNRGSGRAARGRRFSPLYSSRCWSWKGKKRDPQNLV